MKRVFCKMLNFNTGDIADATEYKNAAAQIWTVEEDILIIGATLEVNTGDFPCVPNTVKRATCTSILTQTGDWSKDGQMLRAFQEREVESLDATATGTIYKMNDAIPHPYFMLPEGYGIPVKESGTIYLGLHFQNETGQVNNAGGMAVIFYVKGSIRK